MCRGRRRGGVWTLIGRLCRTVFVSSSFVGELVAVVEWGWCRAGGRIGCRTMYAVYQQPIEVVGGVEDAFSPSDHSVSRVSP